MGNISKMESKNYPVSPIPTEKINGKEKKANFKPITSYLMNGC